MIFSFFFFTSKTLILYMFSDGEFGICRNIRRESKRYINLNPIQRGGIIPKETIPILNEWLDGYSICDFCEGRLEDIKSPPIEKFVHDILPKFLDIDVVRLTNGAREAKFAVMHALCKSNDRILIDQNAHYSTFISAERLNLEIHEVPNSGYPEFKINPEDYAEKIEEVNPRLVLLTYPDGNYGNLPDARRVGKICSEYGIPLILNCAYSVGRMPISARKLNADFIIGSGHKSMASSGPIGILGIKGEWEDEILRKSKRYKNKEIEFLGCGPRGLPTVSLMASFPYVAKRVERWDKEVEKARYFIKKIEEIDGIRQLGEKPKNHDLIFIESSRFYEISKRHKKGRFFLYHELKKRGIIGIKPGLTKNFKMSTYQLKKNELNMVIDAFSEIANL